MGTILEDVKKALGIVPGYDAFDDQILMYINSARMDLAQLGPKCLGIIKKEFPGGSNMSRTLSEMYDLMAASSFTSGKTDH